MNIRTSLAALALCLASTAAMAATAPVAATTPAKVHDRRAGEGQDRQARHHLQERQDPRERQVRRREGQELIGVIVARRNGDRHRKRRDQGPALSFCAGRKASRTDRIKLMA